MNVIGLDLGTTGCKAVLVSETGEVLRSTYRSYPLVQTDPGEASQNALVLWKAVQDTLKDLDALDAAGLSFSGAMHSLLLLDLQNQPLMNALTWADTRPSDTLEGLDPHEVYLRTGAPLKAPYWPAKIRYLQTHHPQAFGQAVRMVGLKDFIAFQLTGHWFTDIGLASATGMLNLHTRDWDEALTEHLQVQHLLPEVIDADDLLGNITLEAAACTGLRAGMPVFAGSSDGAMANLGTGASGEDTVITVGTSGAVRRMTSAPLLDSEGRTWCYYLSRNQMFCGGAINNGGILLDWVRRMFYPEGFDAMFTEVAQVESCGVLLLPYLTGERSPHWNSELTATLHGVTLQHTRAHIARAAMEAVCFCLADVFDLVGTGSERVLVTGGITHSPVWLQTLSNVLDRPLTVANRVDASAMGAAMVTLHALDKHLGGLTYKVQYAVGFTPQPGSVQPLEGTRAQWRELFKRIWKEQQHGSI